MASVLVVEDDDDTRRLMSRWLEADGHRVSLAGDGEVALELSAGERYDLAVVDVRLPGIDGFEVARSLADSARTALLMCTVSDREDAPESIAAHHWLGKPFTRGQFLAAVATALQDGNA